jgi:serine/threonine protein kinase
MAELEGGDPREVGPYRVLGRLGSGGMGRVFLARSPGGRYVAVKVVRPELAEQTDFRVRFAREVAAAQKVSGLFTAPVVDADLEAPVPWVATAYVSGPSLADAVTRHGPLPVPSVLALAAGLAEGLGAIHRAGIVHRDLKPSNVLLAEDGPRVIDFGISRAAEESALTGTGLVVGSPGFMSPEQARGRPVGPPSDVFSLGAVLTFAATGQGPFGTGSTAVLLYRVVFEPPATEGLPAELRPLVERCLAKDPQQRPGTGQLLAELNAHPAAGWLPAPIAQGLPPLPPAAVGPAGDGAARPATELAAPGRPLSPGASGGPSTITTSSLPPGATAGRFPPAGGGRRPPRSRRRQLAWALAAAALLAAAAATAVALASTVGRPRQQPAAAGTQAASSPAATVPGTRQAPTVGTSSSSSVQAPPPSSTPLSARTSSPSNAPSPAQASGSPGIQPVVPSGAFWAAAVLSSHYQRNAQAMTERLSQSGFDGEYWWSTAANSVLPGYWVVTSGHFADQADASAQARALQAAGFTGAYPRCVGSRQACPA